MTPETLAEIKKTFDLDRFRGKTYGDFLIPDKGKNVADSRSSASLVTRFSTHTKMNQPIVSANMLDVTEHEMAITNALLGGLGIIHRFCPIDFQADEIRRTKRAQNFIIREPYKVRPSVSVQEARNKMAAYKVGSLLVHDENNRLLGMLTSRDVRFVNDLEVAENVMTRRKNLKVVLDNIKTLENATDKFKTKKIKKLPIVDKHNRIRGLISAKDVLKLQQYPLANLDHHGRLVVGAAIGTVGDYLERAQELIRAGADVLVLDVTSCHSSLVETAIKNIHRKMSAELVAGNIGTSEQADFLIKLGVDGIKIGVGPGGACTTRMNTGMGVPQLFAILEIYWNLIFKYNYPPASIPPLCADGGIRRGADITHSLFAGADSVMIGTMFAATEETPGAVYPREDGNYKLFHGMASTEALIARYEAEGRKDPISEALRKGPEGMRREVKVKGSAEKIIRDLTDGVRSAVTRRGCMTLQEAKDGFNPFDPVHGFHVLSQAAREESFNR